METFRGKIEILKQETGSHIKLSYLNIEVAVTLIITQIRGNQNGQLHFNFIEGRRASLAAFLLERVFSN